MSRRVVISGIGIYTSIGKGKEEFFKNLMAQKQVISPIPKKYELNYTFKSRFYSPLPPVKLEEFDMSSSLENTMQEEDKIAVVCAKMALEDSGIKTVNKGKYYQAESISESGVILGIGISSLERSFKSYVAHILKNAQEEGKRLDTKFHYSRMIIPQTMPNSVTSWVSVFFQLFGPNYTLNSACASGTIAIGEAFRKL